DLVRRYVEASSLFPYTTLFRSGNRARVATLTRRFSAGFGLRALRNLWRNDGRARLLPSRNPRSTSRLWAAPARQELPIAVTLIRSEEHTSELQSQSNLVCRLLL